MRLLSFINSKKTKIITKKIMKFMALNDNWFSVAEDKGLKHFMYCHYRIWPAWWVCHAWHTDTRHFTQNEGLLSWWSITESLMWWQLGRMIVCILNTHGLPNQNFTTSRYSWVILGNDWSYKMEQPLVLIWRHMLHSMSCQPHLMNQWRLNL